MVKKKKKAVDVDVVVEIEECLATVEDAMDDC